MSLENLPTVTRRFMMRAQTQENDSDNTARFRAGIHPVMHEIQVMKYGQLGTAVLRLSIPSVKTKISAFHLRRARVTL